MKKRLLNVLLVVGLLSLVFGCTIKQEVFFNKDFSGNYKYSFDFVEYISYMGEDQADSTALKNEDFVEYLGVVKSALQDMNGISNLKIVNDAENGLVYFNYDFANVQALNAAMKYSTLMELEPKINSPYFELKKKTLTYIRHAEPAEEAAEGEEDTSYMNEMFKWEFNISFESGMKKYNVQKDTAVTISKGNRTFIESGNIFDVAKKESKWVFKTE